MRDPVETYMQLVPMVVEQTTAASAPTTFFAPAEGAHHLFDRTGRGWHVDPGGRAASVSRSRESEEGNLDVHQFARRRGDVGSCDLRHHAVHPSAGVDALHGSGGVDGFAAVGRRPSGHALLAANSRIMVHQPSGGFQGQATDIMLHAQES